MLPWLDKAIDAARDVGAIPEADVISKWDVTRELSGIESFKPVMELITLIGLIGKDITYIRGGASSDMGQLHKRIHDDYQTSLKKLQDRLFCFHHMECTCVLCMCICILTVNYVYIYINKKAYVLHRLHNYIILSLIKHFQWLSSIAGQGSGFAHQCLWTTIYRPESSNH